MALRYCHCLRVCVYVCVCVHLSINHELVRRIIHQPFKLGSPNLEQRCKRPWLRALLFVGRLIMIFKGKLNSKSKFTPFWACPCHNSPPTEVTISKFGTKMHLSTQFWAWLKLIFDSTFNFKPTPNCTFYVHHWYCLVRTASLKVGRIEGIQREWTNSKNSHWNRSLA